MTAVRRFVCWYSFTQDQLGIGLTRRPSIHQYSSNQAEGGVPMMRDDPRKMSDRQTLAEADPEFDALDLHTGLWRAIHRTLPERWQTPALAGPPEEGRDWWHGVVGDHCLPYLEVGLDYAGVIEALRRAQADAVEHYS